MAENTAMPLWLDIKKEYIDENIDGVLSYLHKRVKNTALQDSFYQTTVNLLEERVQSLIQTITAAPLQENMCKDEDLSLVCRMCAMYLLVFPEDTELRRNAYSLMLQSLLEAYNGRVLLSKERLHRFTACRPVLRIRSILRSDSDIE